MIISTLSLAIMNTILKYLHHIPTFELVFFRAATTLVICTVYLKTQRISYLGKKRKLMLLRGLMGSGSVICFFFAIKYIPMGAAVSLRYLSPIFAAVLSIFILGERMRKWQWFFYTIAFFGVVVLKKFDPQITMTGFLFAVGSAFFSGWVYIIVRSIGKDENPIRIVNYFMFCATFIGGLVSITNWKMPIGMDWTLLLSLGVFGFFGQLFMTKAFQSTETSRIAPTKYLETVFVIIIGVIWFDERYGWLSIIGILLIMFGMTANLLIKKK